MSFRRPHEIKGTIGFPAQASTKKVVAQDTGLWHKHENNFDDTSIQAPAFLCGGIAIHFLEFAFHDGVVQLTSSRLPEENSF
jgi:hypothetical protein